MNIEITDLDLEGRGVGRADGLAVFVPGLLPGERAEITIEQRQKRFAIGASRKLLRPSPLRVAPACPIYEHCGGCSWQHIDSSQQLALKEKIWLEQLRRIGKCQPELVLPPVDGPHWHYRRRANLHWDGRQLGFRGRRSHRVVPLQQCLTLDPALNAIIPALTELCRANGRAVQSVHLAAGAHLNVAQLEVRNWLKALPRWAGWQIRQRCGRQLRSFPEKAPPLSYLLPELALEINFAPEDFTQINGAINRQLVQLVLQELQVEKGEKVLDLFCGLGNFSLPLARAGAQVLAIEGVKEMVQKGQLNAQANKLALEFRAADLGKTINWQPLDGFKKWLIDPPRAGAKELLTAMPLRPRRLVYVSCNPSTLARDAAILLAKGYRFESGRLLNMFAQTAHVESLCVFGYL